MTSAKNEDSRFNQLISEQAAGVRMSAIKEMAMLSAQLDDVASLTWGVPSFRTPEYIRQAVIDQLSEDEDIGKYALPDGLSQLRQLVVQHYMAATGIEASANDHVMIAAGNMQAMSTVLHSLINPGDEIILTDPCFSSHIQQVKLFGGQAVFWPLDENNDWALNVDLLPELISHKTKAIIIVSPSNPTGKIFSQQKLLAIAEIARKQGFMVLIDDPYSHFLYDSKETYFNLASVADLSDQLVYMFSFSKAYAMSGWRLSYMILPAWLKAQIIKIHDLNMICTPRISQVAGIAALSSRPTHIAEFEARLEKRRELICQRLDGMPHVFQYIRPEGAYYVFPRIVREHQSASQFCLDVLYQSKVTLTPGSAFGPSGESHVRMAYCVSEEIINKAFDRLEARFGRV